MELLNNEKAPVSNETSKQSAAVEDVFEEDNMSNRRNGNRRNIYWVFSFPTHRNPLSNQIVEPICQHNPVSQLQPSIKGKSNVPVIRHTDKNVPVSRYFYTRTRPTTYKSQPTISKCDIPCPFLLGRGWCIKADHCDYLHKNQCYQYRATTPKHLVPCPILKKKGFRLKGSLCDFSHAHIYTITNRNSSFFEKRQDLVKRGCEVSKESRPISNKSHPGWISTGPLGRCKLCILRSVDLWW